jgi:hypothetical protein
VLQIDVKQVLQLDGNVDVYKTECNRMLKYNINIYVSVHVIESNTTSYNCFFLRWKSKLHSAMKYPLSSYTHTITVQQLPLSSPLFFFFVALVFQEELPMCPCIYTRFVPKVTVILATLYRPWLHVYI